MATNTLDAAMASIRTIWGPLTTELVEASRLQIATLAQASPEEPWLAALHRDRPARRELYRDPVHGFVLLAHVEQADIYRPPHDHGRSWVIYAVHNGESRMGAYVRVDDPAAKARLVRRDTTLVGPGQVQVYLPGDIHDTYCVTGPAILFRFTERDLEKEDRVDRAITRYVRRDDHWSEP